MPGWLVPVIPGAVWFGLPVLLRRAGMPIVWIHPQVMVWTAVAAALCLTGWANGVQRRRLARTVQSIEALRALSWQAFEKLVGQAYRDQGWTVSENWKGGADGGVDLDLRRGNERMVVQCKQWRTRQVPVQEVRALWGVVASESASGGIFVTCGGYTKDALAFARGKNLRLVDGATLVTMLRGVQAEEIPADHAVSPAETVSSSSVESAEKSAATETKECPRCGGEMVLRTARKGAAAGETFWGCASFPRCRGTRPAAG